MHDDLIMSTTTSAPEEALLWSPDQARKDSSNMMDFMEQANRKFGLTLSSYPELHQWSVSAREDFWQLMAEYAGIRFSTPADQICKNPDTFPSAEKERSEWASWFPGARLNFAENLLKRRDQHPALIACGEPLLNNGEARTLSYAELYDAVARTSSGLKALGVTRGDRVAAFMPNTLETVIAMLATTSIGAVWTSCSPDFGIQGVLDRFGQIQPKILITTDGYFYGGKILDSLSKVQEICNRITSIEHTVVVPHTTLPAGNISPEGIPHALTWQTLNNNDAKEIEFEPVPFDHPLYIMYSSGTTGTPKCIVHGTGGTLIQHAKELILHTDLKPGDTIFYYTTCGWMMWNWLVSSLCTGATTVLYDGSPFYPDGHCLWQMAEQHNISIFGTSAKYLSALEKAEIKPGQDYNLPDLKAILSTGSPLSHESFDYVYRDISDDVCLSSISGGTDIISCFALGNPILPVYRGELQCAGLGMAVEILSDDGNSVTGEKGELVCTLPFPSCPIGFWADQDNRKFHDAYFADYANIWAHGDYGEITDHNGVIIHGRSDAVLNPGGVRIGTAEIYRQVEKLEYITESIAIGQEWEQDVRIVLFVILKENITLDDDMRQEIRTIIRSNATPRHVPAKIIQVSDIPRTISGKIVELAVRNVVHDRPVKNTDALKNPEALNLYRDIPELKV